jgi:hypothetical protein
MASDYRPSVELVRIPTAPTGESVRERKSCKPPGYCTVGTRSVLETAVGNRSSVGGTITDIIHTKVLQISTLRAVRSMRAVDVGDTLREVLRTSGAVEVTRKRSLMAGSFKMKLFPTAACRLFKHLSSTSFCRD